MDKKRNEDLVPLAKTLRSNMTKEEKHLWYDFLRGHAAHFRRQAVLGHYIVDFYSSTANLVIELDGSQHYTTEAKVYDANRTEYLQQYGVKVIRFLNRDIQDNFYGVCKYIDKIICEGE